MSMTSAAGDAATAASNEHENVGRPEEWADEVAAKFAKARESISEIIFGQPTVVDQTLVTLLSGGNGLLIGLPGLAKTRLVDTLGTVLGMDTKRIQFTPDLMPGDIVGSEVLEEDDEGKRSFRFVKGPVFCQLLMADEINRASPRTQSALLQAMQERHVTVAGERFDLPSPFHVLATQNPLEQEGTYPLPEAQLDRFLLQIDVGYPDRAAEERMVLATTVGDESVPEKVLEAGDLLRAQSLVRRLPVGEKVVSAILGLVRSARPDADASEMVQNFVAWGPGPRASQAFMLAIRARALLEGRFAPSVDDVLALAQPILRHRMALNFSARAEGKTIAQVIDTLCDEYR
jgi:MoxR-like ATPase